jgi:hypothetical protein
MAIIYSYPLVASLQTTDLFIISRLPEDPEEISNYSVTLNSLSTYIIDQAFNGTNNYIPKFDGTASLVNSLFYETDTGRVGLGTTTPSRKLQVVGDAIIDTDLEVDGGLDVAGTVRLGFTGNDPVILGNPTGKRTEWNNPGYFEMYAENPFSPGDFNETVDIDGDYYGGGFIGVYPANTEDAHGVRMHVITDPSSAPWGSSYTDYFHNFIDVAKANRPSDGSDEQNIRLSDIYSVRTTGEIENYAGIKINHPTENRFRFNSEFSTEPTVPFLVNDNAKINGSLTMGANSIFLGGTGSANEFDDYEEGTFTPSISSYTGGSITPVYNSQLGEYTKVGNIVTASIYLSLDTSTTFSGTGDLIFAGLPFGIKTQGSFGGQVSGTLSYFRKFDDATMSKFVGAGRSVASTTVSLNKAVQIGSAPPDDKSTPITTADMVNTGSFYGDYVIAFTIIYRT